MYVHYACVRLYFYLCEDLGVRILGILGYCGKVRTYLTKGRLRVKVSFKLVSGLRSVLGFGQWTTVLYLMIRLGII